MGTGTCVGWQQDTFCRAFPVTFLVIGRVYKSNRPQVSMVYRLINDADVSRTPEEFENQEPQESGLRILSVFCQHPKWFISL